MDSVNSHGGAYSNSNQDAGLLNFPKDLGSHRSTEGVYPSRPSSRLGFNRTILSTNLPDPSPDSKAIQWSHSLFQNVGISDLHLSPSKHRPPTKNEMVDPAYLNPLDNTKNEASFKSLNKNLTSSDCPDDFARSPVVPRKSPKNSPPSVSRLCFPFVTTPSPRRNKPPPPPPPPRHKYSCFPSLMSPVSPGRPSPKHQRHSYRQHGYSRLALHHVKWFWSMREEEWEGPNPHLHDTSAYGGISPAGATPPVHLSSPCSTHPHVSQSLPPITVHPRRGDIAALRDPYCMHIDRCFIGLPTWTIGKTLWMYDLHLATEQRVSRQQILSDEDGSDADSESETETSTSTGFSDDSDTTLVESESETDLPQLLKFNIGNAPKGKDDGDEREKGSASSSSRPLHQISPGFSSDQHILDNDTWLKTMKDITSKLQTSDKNKAQWATTWYRRWELLVELSRHDRDRRHSMFEMNAPPLEIVPSPKNDIPGRRFLLGPESTKSDDDNA
ncbi:hypothetical protein GALMADRAFT_248223 [Galerina marginata CBS 339.88]|uniref:Uncharacterized protein n=1 Tax=Galerina marginata (strain CBS 339.88) TaxID=685588 RepID=A0A067SXL5_GALM3|nr:hypothetical protein GALMADRAFT_248223 [Galerina marginata CBS 339.88]